MSGESWKRAWAIFEQVVELPESERRAALLAACGDDPALREVVRGLLAADAEDQHLLDRPLMDDGTFGETTAVGGLLGAPVRRVDAELESGAMVGSYRIVRLLAEGGMGAVYLAVRADDSFDRRVVLKLVRSDRESSQILERLRKERRILAALDHPYISRLYDETFAS